MNNGQRGRIQSYPYPITYFKSVCSNLGVTTHSHYVRLMKWLFFILISACIIL